MGITVKALLALAVVSGIIWTYYILQPHSIQPQITINQEQHAPQKQNQNSVTTSGSTDSSLQADIVSIDTQMTAAEHQSASTEANYIDNPVQQSE